MKVVKTGTIIFFLASGLSALNCYAQVSEGSSGVIHFHGTIVNETCEVNNDQSMLNVSCPNSSSLAIKTSYVDVYSQKNLENSKSNFNVKWLDDSRQMGIVTVTLQ